jgi:hypothetical protein
MGIDFLNGRAMENVNEREGDRERAGLGREEKGGEGDVGL